MTLKKPGLGRIVLIMGVLLFFLSGCQPALEAENPSALFEIQIGYCPTMQAFMNDLAERHPEVRIVEFPNSSAALEALRSGSVHAVVIGRIAWEGEIADDVRLVRVEDGLTLIAAQQGVILYENLRLVPILTIEAASEVENLLPEGTTVRYFQNFDEMASELTGSVAVLLRWSQVVSGHNLLIPVDELGDKISSFRSPHLYYSDDDHQFLSPLIEDILYPD